jgi:hypothetical protein
MVKDTQDSTIHATSSIGTQCTLPLLVFFINKPDGRWQRKKRKAERSARMLVR